MHLSRNCLNLEAVSTKMAFPPERKRLPQVDLKTLRRKKIVCLAERAPHFSCEGHPGVAASSLLVLQVPQDRRMRSLQAILWFVGLG